MTDDAGDEQVRSRRLARQAAPDDPGAADQDEGGGMPFRAHLIELRDRTLRATIGVFAAFFIAWAWHVEIFEWLSAPIRAAMADNGLFAIKALQITESISVYVRLSLVGAIFLASPWVFWQVWSFIAPGLLRSEKRVAVPILTASVGFFVGGAAFCYFVVLPFMTDFLIKMTIEADGLTLEPTLASTTSYAMWLLLAFGLVFELPVFMYFLSALGLVTARGLLAFYRYWIVIAAIIGAVLTPTPDPFNQMLMSGPLVVLYGVGIGIAWVVESDQREGRLLSARGATVLALLLAVAGFFVYQQNTSPSRRDALADVPRDALQIVGVHRPALGRLVQQAGTLSGRSALGPLHLVGFFGVKAQGPQLWLVRTSAGVAVIVPCENAAEVPTRLSQKHRSSLLQQAGGPSMRLRLPGDERLWQITAPQDDVLWIGHDAVLAQLAATRTGERAGLTEDVHFAEMVEELRAGGPLWSLTLSPSGIAGWLPNGALADQIDRASAVIDADGKRLVVRLVARSEVDARSIRDRLTVWSAEVRAKAEQLAASPPTDDRVELLTRRLAAIASIIGRIGETAAKALPDGSSEQITLLSAGHDAGRLGRELRSVTPPPQTIAYSPLDALVVPPSIFELALRNSVVSWKTEADPAVLVAALLAPSKIGFDPARLDEMEPKRDANTDTNVDANANADANADINANAPALSDAPVFVRPVDDDPASGARGIVAPRAIERARPTVAP